jgi:demethylmenaquinone methyltransferase/2-methoxy-6-polyprenyl-1,4-benzoquinol methylase
VLEEDALCSSIETESLDAVLCSYGVKTLSQAGQDQFVREVKRILKDGGSSGWSRFPSRDSHCCACSMFYISRIVPLVGRVLLGNPENYRMLGVYVSRFGDCRDLASRFAASGFEVRYQSFFWGCASGLAARRRAREAVAHSSDLRRRFVQRRFPRRDYAEDTTAGLGGQTWTGMYWGSSS